MAWKQESWMQFLEVIGDRTPPQSAKEARIYMVSSTYVSHFLNSSVANPSFPAVFLFTPHQDLWTATGISSNNSQPATYWQSLWFVKPDHCIGEGAVSDPTSNSDLKLQSNKMTNQSCLNKQEGRAHTEQTYPPSTRIKLSTREQYTEKAV